TPSASTTSRSLVTLCTATRATEMRTPERCVIRSALSSRARMSAAPTFPHPKTPTRTTPLCMANSLADAGTHPEQTEQGHTETTSPLPREPFGLVGEGQEETTSACEPKCYSSESRR